MCACTCVCVFLRILPASKKSCSICYLSSLILSSAEDAELGGKPAKDLLSNIIWRRYSIFIDQVQNSTCISIRRYAYTRARTRTCSWKSIAMRHRRRQTVRDEPVGTKCPGMSLGGWEEEGEEEGEGWSDTGRPDRGFILYFMADSPCAPSVTSAV